MRRRTASDSSVSSSATTSSSEVLDGDRTDVQLDDFDEPVVGAGFFYLITAEGGPGFLYGPRRELSGELLPIGSMTPFPVHKIQYMNRLDGLDRGISEALHDGAAVVVLSRAEVG